MVCRATDAADTESRTRIGASCHDLHKSRLRNTTGVPFFVFGITWFLLVVGQKKAVWWVRVELLAPMLTIAASLPLWCPLLCRRRQRFHVSHSQTATLGGSSPLHLILKIVPQGHRGGGGVTKCYTSALCSSTNFFGARGLPESRPPFCSHRLL